MTYKGFLEHDRWLSMKNELKRFSLVTDAGDLSNPPSKWSIRARNWLNEKVFLRRLKASMLEETYAKGQLSIDPTRYLALCFRNESCYLVEVADVSPGHNGKVLFADGYLGMTEDFRRLIEEAYGLKSFTTYE